MSGEQYTDFLDREVKRLLNENASLEKQVEALKAEAAEWQRQAIYHNKMHGEMVEKNRGLRAALLCIAASLSAAISLLERTPKSKKAAPSDRMFDQMIADYKKSLEEGRLLLKDEE